MNYRRAYIQNSFVHIVIASYNRIPVFIDNIEILRTAFKNTMSNYKFEIIAICVLPDHIHLILNPENINEYPKIISSVKYYFSRNVGQVCPTYTELALGYKNKREKGIFQRRFYEHTILNEDELNRNIDYVHFNPVKHGYVKSVKDWEYSSFHKFVKNNLYDINWGSEENILNIKDLNVE
ncbi:transposase [bacterium]|nr:transposase [bacterium]